VEIIGKEFKEFKELQGEGVRSQNPGARIQNPESRSQEPGARSQEPGARRSPAATSWFVFDSDLVISPGNPCS
jgi:hypothetical protein